MGHGEHRAEAKVASCPRGHCLHLTLPKSLLYCPNVHDVHFCRQFTLLNFPGGHALHLAAPVDAAYQPTVQARQYGMPAFANRPTLQALHRVRGPVDGDVFPALHLSHTTIPLFDEKRPAGHNEQTVALALLYFPGAHKPLHAEVVEPPKP